jgi:tRNA (guanine26-N2/guanine27-N2)-dimethyltransferase
VFYNPAMAADRDLATALVRAWAAGRTDLRGWDLHGATGVRALRLLRETGAFASFLITDSHPAAGPVLRANFDGAPGVTVRGADAREPPPEGPFDYVDVDPYGSPLPFLPTALDAVALGGLLAVTATDLMVLAGAQPGACLRRYGARPVRGRLGPEGGLRILLATLSRAAGDRSRAIHPVLAYVRGHHVRAYVELRPGPEPTPPIREIDPSNWTGPALGTPGPYGPLWTGPLFDPTVVERLEVPPAAAQPREVAVLRERFRAECRVDVPFYFEPNSLARALGAAAPIGLEGYADALRAAGYRFARTHARPEGFRTDAPRAVVEAVARQSQNARVRA